MRDNLLHRLPPNVKGRIWAGTDDPLDRKFLSDIFAPIPPHVAKPLLKEWERRRATSGARDANLYALSLKTDVFPELFPDVGLPFHATDDEIADAADKAAGNVRVRLRLQNDDAARLQVLERAARRYRVALPRCEHVSNMVSRMREPTWWRRALRRRFQVVEHAAIRAGCVHRHAAPYVSDEAFRRHQRQVIRTAAMLQRLDAVNLDTGETLAMADIAEGSLANPANRRAAMMVCVRGLEERAKALGFAPLFLTITCPSRMHARLASSGDANPAYDGTSPARAQQYLSRHVWNAANRCLQHAGIRPGVDYFGVRVVEPHHDATPHWHLLTFVREECEKQFIAALRAYALADSADERGAAERRFTVQRIDPAKGSAAGYVAKYVSKNIDGHAVGDDLELAAGVDSRSTAHRVVTWARLWNTRQFQFFGVGAVTPFRELYRLDRVPEPLEAILSDLWQAARDGDFGAFIGAREARKTRLALLYEATDSTRYPGELAKRVRGIVIHGEAAVPVSLVTRPDTWQIKMRPLSANAAKQPFFALTNSSIPLPWTRFNNSASPDLTGNSHVKQRVAGEAERGGERSAPNRAPLPGQGHACRTRQRHDTPTKKRRNKNVEESL
ncbi:MAG: replication endonuclease [Frankiales bacterium]|nr:replication endonuclease [Frankiales bacterium]